MLIAVVKVIMIGDGVHVKCSRGGGRMIRSIKVGQRRIIFKLRLIHATSVDRFVFGLLSVAPHGKGLFIADVRIDFFSFGTMVLKPGCDDSSSGAQLFCYGFHIVRGGVDILVILFLQKQNFVSRESTPGLNHW
jgi:hypothetical protein